jgi:anti-sigma regulatory factor (Ser/Thr protein kinase)
VDLEKTPNAERTAAMPSSGLVDLHEHLEADADTPGRARDLVEDALSGRVQPDTLRSVRLMTSELATNAVRHGSPLPNQVVDVTVRVTQTVIRVDVQDEGAGFVLIGLDDPADLTGLHLGLRLVESLADRWGMVREQGTRVWFEIDRKGEDEA